MKCSHCPAIGPACLGEQVKRLCDLIDPGHLDYRPGYRATIPLHPPYESDPDQIIARVEAMAAQSPRGGCCP